MTWRALGFAAALLGAAASPSRLVAQAAVLEGPFGGVLPSITPDLVARAFNLGSARPLRYELQISTSVDFNTGIVLDSAVTSPRTCVR